MSASLTHTIESLHITAAQRLIHLIQTESDPTLLARLLAIAVRFKVPKPTDANPTPKPNRLPKLPDTPPAPASLTTQPTPQPTPAAPDTHPLQTPSPTGNQANTTNASANDNDGDSNSDDTDTGDTDDDFDDDFNDEDVGPCPESLIPLPYTDEQYRDLIRQYGSKEAEIMQTRRLAIIADLRRPPKPRPRKHNAA